MYISNWLLLPLRHDVTGLNNRDPVKCESKLIKSNQIKFYLYSTFLNDFWSSQSAVHIIKIPYSKDTLQQIQQHSLLRISVTKLKQNGAI